MSSVNRTWALSPHTSDDSTVPPGSSSWLSAAAQVIDSSCSTAAMVAGASSVQRSAGSVSARPNTAATCSTSVWWSAAHALAAGSSTVIVARRSTRRPDASPPPDLTQGSLRAAQPVRRDRRYGEGRRTTPSAGARPVPADRLSAVVPAPRRIHPPRPPSMLRDRSNDSPELCNARGSAEFEHRGCPGPSDHSTLDVAGLKPMAASTRVPG
ncbi:MAG: hypothetical protein AVDCRST_MAG66-704 [uncultured Pseudonocardia sp.]|uniref:Uncharacterized protein n=1 Tax=uncultured Pseudonocardia sp. TaxID=211455 RepID=A0A6J4NHI0_9PSEU|nr:MAG: hypothetical protein AVDCRST_MAG66-704 [uncultured Pseudonocardia sp.]